MAHRVVGLLLVGDVGLEDQRGAAVATDAGGQLVETILAPGHQRDRGTLGGQCDGGGSADPARGTGDEGDGAGQSRHSTVTLLARLRG